MSALNLNSIREAGAFTGQPVKKTITWTNGDGDEVANDVWVRRLSYASAVGEVRAFNSGGEATAERISACILDESGARVFPTAGHITGEHDDVDGALCDSLVYALLGVIGEVNAPKPKG